MDDRFLIDCLKYTTGKDNSIFTYNDNKFLHGLEDIVCRLAALVPIYNRYLYLRHNDFAKAPQALCKS